MYIDERNFVTTACQQIQVLETTWSTPADGCVSKYETATREALEQIMASANTVQARGVYRAARLCEDVLARTGNECTSKLSSAMTSLKHMVNQYKDGLIEIDPGFNWRAPDQTIYDLRPEDEIRVGPEELEAAHENAAQKLASLMHLVREPAQENALSFLMRASDGADQSHIEDIEKTSVSFDALMHPLNNLILSEARHTGKTVSISYAADFVRINKVYCEQLQNLLEIVCLNIVANGIAPTKPGSGSQISITGQGKPDNLYFLISWRGHELSAAARQKPHFAKAVSELSQRGGSVEFNSAVLAETGKARHTISMVWPRMSASQVVEQSAKNNDLTAFGAR